MEFINQNILLIGVVVTSGLGLAWPLFMRPGGNQVSPAEATLLINRNDAHIVDVREADEFAAGHLPDARHFPLSKLSERIGELDKLNSLAGGVDAWVGAGYPIKKGKAGK